ncbi:hypothetical protein Bca52824_080378 [Brassica carinata]|uniref:Replication factor A C-terminal domain-containing protein n=1 Tax=Brassica carinata TaxID=52824 RepID=A0A8X7PGH9_BRACI|nr:hypothetical protein Bca52824_080378 [Brassica carinata]
MRMLVLQCALINPPLKIPTAPQHPPSGSMISRSLFIPLSLLPQTSYMRSSNPYPYHGKKDCDPYQRSFFSSPLPTCYTRTRRFHLAVQAYPFLRCSQESAYDRCGGKLCLSSMSSSRVFLDEEVDPTKEYLTWLSTNPSATSSVNPVEVVKSETLTISEIADFIKRQPAKIAYVDCIATIDDVKLGTEWYYIACKDCQTKLNRGPTTMLCPKCGNENATAVANYRVEMSVYDNEEQCTFIILGDAGKDLTGRKATELIDTYVEENGGDGAELEIPLPQYFIDAIGQTKKFRIKVAHYNFTSTRLSLTDTKIVSSAVLPPKNPPLKTPPGSEVEMSELAESSGVVLQPVTTRRKQSVPSLVARSHAV